MLAFSYKYWRLTHTKALGLVITDLGVFVTETSKVINKVD